MAKSLTRRAIVFYYDFCQDFFGTIMGRLFLIILTCITAFSSCSSIKNSLYAMLDTRNGEQILSNEPNVRKFLENILDSPEEYVFTAYERCVTWNQKKRTKLMSHSYYVISNPSRNEYHTISFFGTDFWFYSRGTWTMDTDFDLYSYRNYIDGNKRWDVMEIETGSGVDTAKTVKNIINKMDMGIRYYFRDHIKNKPGVDNCNTALWETLTLR